MLYNPAEYVADQRASRELKKDAGYHLSALANQLDLANFQIERENNRIANEVCLEDFSQNVSEPPAYGPEQAPLQGPGF